MTFQLLHSGKTWRGSKQNTMKPISKSELALQYVPNVTPHSAVNRLMAWINGCKALVNELAKTGYSTRQKYLSAEQVKLIHEYLGEP